MRQKTYRGGEGKNTPASAGRRGPDLPTQPAAGSQAIARNERGEEQPTDKARAQQAHKQETSEGEKAQREAAERQPPSPGEPAGHE
jgi:hypothetical protein